MAETKKSIEAYLRLIHNLSTQAVKIANNLFSALDPKPEMVNPILDELYKLEAGKVTDIDEYVQTFFSEFIPEDMPGGEHQPHTVTVIADGPETVEIRIPTGEGGCLIPYTYGCDYGTVAAGVSYMEATTQTEIDLFLSEVKKGALARNDNPNNEDVDYYIYSNPFDTDFQSNGTMRYEDIKKAVSD